MKFYHLLKILEFSPRPELFCQGIISLREKVSMIKTSVMWENSRWAWLILDYLFYFLYIDHYLYRKCMFVVCIENLLVIPHLLTFVCVATVWEGVVVITTHITENKWSGYLFVYNATHHFEENQPAFVLTES